MVQHVFMAAHSVKSMLGDKEEGPQVAGRTPECTHSLGTAWKEGWGGRSGPSYGGGKTSTVQTLNWSRGQAEKGAGRQAGRTFQGQKEFLQRPEARVSGFWRRRQQKLEHSDFGDLNKRSESFVLRTGRQESHPKHPVGADKGTKPP